MKYAIVDIETTGGHANANGITEIAILIHNGEEVVESYSSLFNPQRPIPVYIRALTGINEEMVAGAPLFQEEAARIFELLQDKIFIAHNVNFDFSFLKYHLGQAGFDLQVKKLCTVRLSRKIFPGLGSYSLGKLCNQLGISIYDRHRALGDATATATLFTRLLKADNDGHIVKSLNQRSKEQLLPPHLPKEDIDKLPSSPGVYYFHNSKAKVVYVGKAVDLRKRVNSHFANNKPGRQKQDFIRDIHHISFVETGTELVALVLESLEIRRLWPAYNRALKRPDHTYGLYQYEDQNGYLRLVIDKKRKYAKQLITFGLISDGYNLLRDLISEYQLCARLCFIQRKLHDDVERELHQCLGACTSQESAVVYNERVNAAIRALTSNSPTFALFDAGRNEKEQSCILVENGQLSAIGFVDSDARHFELSTLKSQLTAYPTSDYVRNLILGQAQRNPHKVHYYSSLPLGEGNAVIEPLCFAVN